MGKKATLGVLAILFFAAILFTPQDSNMWIYFGILGIVLGIAWFVTEE